MKKIFSMILASAPALAAQAEARFPKPDFTSGYQYPEILHPQPLEHIWAWVDIALLVLMMGVVAWAVHRRQSRRTIVGVSILSVGYFGFFRSGCVCSVGSLQNVALALADSSYQLPLVVLLVFLLPLLFAFLFGRVFCAGVCPLGALQELVNVKNFRLNRAVSSALSLIPWIYLAFALLYAATRSQFIVCRFDPFIPIFRLGGDVGMISFGVALLLLSTVVGRPFCQFLCPYGALLSLFASASLRKMEVTPKSCINCRLCHHSCPVDALRTPFENRVAEDRSVGARRLLLYLLLLPMLTLGTGWLVSSQADALSLANKQVRLLHMVEAQQANPDLEPTLEVTAFNEMGCSQEELQAEVDGILHEFRLYGFLAGALIGFVLGYKLIRLSVKRTHRTYEIDHSACIACGKCFDYCPQNGAKKAEKKLN